MRRTKGTSSRSAALCAALVAGLAGLAAVAATPASGVTNLYAPQTSRLGSLLAQFAVAPGGSLSALAPAALASGAQDIAVTPDGRFAYVTLSAGTDAGAIARFARGAGGRMDPSGTTATDSDPRGILVDPQGGRVFYARGAGASVQSRPIAADGTLGAALNTQVAGTASFLAMTPAGTSLYVGISSAAAGPRILQFSVSPATGALTPKAPAFVTWPAGPPGASAPSAIARLTLTPDGGHLYAASGTSATGIAHFEIDPSGALSGGTVVGVAGDLNGSSVTPLSPGGNVLWAPTSSGTPGRIDQFAVTGTGALTPLAPASVPYIAAGSARDAVAHPDGGSLYLGQDANVGEWAVAPGGTLGARANTAVGGDTNAGVALAPSQAPVAAFVATTRPAGEPTAFDARGASDPDGTVARYDWAFGDGASLPNGGPTPTHTYTAAGVYGVTLTVTDADGTSTAKLWTGTQLLRNGAPPAQVTHPVSIAQGAPPAPDKGKSVTIVATQGKVRVKVRGSKRYVDVRLLREIPLGSRIDTRKGRVRVTAEVNVRTHRTQSAIFYDGIFDVLQTTGSKPVLVAKLRGGSFAGCAPHRVSAAGVAGVVLAARAAAGGAAARPASAGRVAFVAKKRKRSKRKVRRLWGRGDGDFRTTGRRSAATVRGTWWLVEDRCDGTLTRVKEGRVDVRDTRLKKTVRLRAGKRSIYLAKAP